MDTHCDMNQMTKRSMMGKPVLPMMMRIIWGTSIIYDFRRGLERLESHSDMPVLVMELTV